MTERGVAYRLRNGLTTAAPMAVVVERMILPQAVPEAVDQAADGYIEILPMPSQPDSGDPAKT